MEFKDYKFSYTEAYTKIEKKLPVELQVMGEYNLNLMRTFLVDEEVMLNSLFH